MKIIVLGGTAFIKKALCRDDVEHITVISRDEFKQFNMANQFRDDPVTFLLGDVRDRDAMFKLIKNVDCVFHAAALKHVPSCEAQPLEAIKTNILGTANVLDAASHNGVKKLVYLSTDKSVYPINAMGMSKGLAEKLLIAYTDSPTIMNIVRYGNVVSSRGSVVPFWVEQIKRGEAVTITNPAMTRFLLPLTDAVGLVFDALSSRQRGRVFVKKSKAASMEMLARALFNIYRKIHNGPVRERTNIIGARGGEKLHETLLAEEDTGEAYVSKDHLLNITELTEFLKSLPEVMELFE